MSEYEAVYRKLYLEFAFPLGLILGSFLNVVIGRIPEGMSVAYPPSRCPKCLTPIKWYDNVPVLSWIILRGRCRSCHAPISPRYPTIELLFGLLTLALAQHFGPTLLGVCFLLFVFVLVAVAYIDLDHWIIPLELVVPGTVIGLVATAALNKQLYWWEGVAGAAGGFAIFALIAFVGEKVFKREALGMGDWFLIAMIGAFLGWKALLPVILLASLQGSIVGILLLVLGRDEPGKEPVQAAEGGAPTSETPPPPEQPAAEKSEPAEASDDEENWTPPKNAVPFGPFLSLGALEQLFLGDWLRDFYFRLLHGL